MNKNIFFFILLIFLSNCSLDSKTNIWTAESKNEKNSNIEVKNVFLENAIINKEFNQDIKISLKDKYDYHGFVSNNSNNNGHLNFFSDLENKTKFNFKKIINYQYFDPYLIITPKQNIIFFSGRGNIFKLDKNNKLIWKNNIYSKVEKKLDPILYFATSDKILIVADNISNIYALNLNTGKIIWRNNHSSPFNSQVKIYKDKLFVVDFDNILRCISILNGEEIWNFKTDKTLINSQKKLSIVIDDEKVFFINTLGDITSLNTNNGKLLWQATTENNRIDEESFSTIASDIVLDDNTIYFSNNKNKFFSINSKNGVINWKQSINSYLRPTIIDNLIFTISLEGYLIILDSKSGNILRVTDLFKNIKKKKKNIIPLGFIISKNKIFLSLNTGRLMVVNALDGQVLKILKIDNQKISRPYVSENSMYVIKNNSIIKYN